MAAKFDAEMLKKHHFWFLLIPVGIAVLLCWYALFLEVPDAISGTAGGFEQKKKDLASVQAKSRGLVDEYAKNVKRLDEDRVKMWKQSWDEQKHIFVWPSGYTDKQLAVVKDRRFGDPIPNTDQTLLQFREPEVYHAEYKKLVQELEPMQFRESWQKVLRYQDQFRLAPDYEDMWLAMDDLWVQRTILMAIRDVNARAAEFKIVAPADGKDNPKHRLFQSRNWLLDLELVEKDNKRTLVGTLKNISPRLQVMGVGNKMVLKVWLAPDAKTPFEFLVEGTSVEAGATLKIKSIDKHEIPVDWRATELARVEQQFDLRTVPVKKIEHFVLGKLSDRNTANNLTLKMAKFSEKIAQKESKSGSPSSPSGPSGPPVGGPSSTGMGTGMGLGMGGDANQPAANSKSQNGLERLRYIDVTDQVRRMPLGIAVVTDQSYMNDVLEALARTKLRLQITQVHWSRYHRELNYNSGGSPASPASGASGSDIGRPPVFGMGMGSDFGSAPATSREDQFSANLLELQIYGIISLYEKFYTTIDQGEISATSTTMNVASNLDFIPVPFVATIGSEQVQVTKIDKNRWTITRGFNGTKAAGHPVKAEVFPETVNNPKQ
jgi:hypothetical protein